MTRKTILNGLTLSLMLTLIPTPAHAGWFSSISNYFNQPTKNALVATTTIAGVSLLATFACAWNWWKNSKAVGIKDAIIVQKDKDQTAALDTLTTKLNGEYQEIKKKTQDAHLAALQAEVAATGRITRDFNAKIAMLTNGHTESIEKIKKTHNTANLAARGEMAKIRSENYSLQNQVRALEGTELAQAKKALEMQNESLKEELAQLHVYRKQAREQADQ